MAIRSFGGLDILVNNAGILRDRMLVNMSLEDWDAVVEVHLRGTFAMVRRSVEYWREEAKSGRQREARIINTTSASGLFGNRGQANYGAAKAGIAAFTIIAASELGRYGVTVNAINPGAYTRMTEQARPGSQVRVEPGAFDVSDPENVAPLVAWLACPESSDITGRVFTVRGGQIRVLEGWHAGPSVDNDRHRWETGALGPVVTELMAGAAPNADLWGEIPDRNRSAGSTAGD